MYALCTPSVCVCMMFVRAQSNKVKCRACECFCWKNKKKQKQCSFLDQRDCDEGCEASCEDEFDFTGRFALDSACVT